MSRLLSDSGVELPVLAAPMAGGAGTTGLVTAAGRAGSLGFLAGGYKTADALADQIRTLQAADLPFGVNLFAGDPVTISVEEYRRYAGLLQAEADRYGLKLNHEAPVEDDDGLAEKLDLVTAADVPWVSFTFGIPDSAAVQALRRSGTTVLQTVTSAEEARLAEEAGVDGLIVQASSAGGHSGTLTPHLPLSPAALPDLVSSVRHTTALPLIAAGGIATSADAAAALRAGADATMIGTLLLRTDESGASAVHKQALVDPAFDSTTLTRAFTGRPARALRNHFADRYDPVAPAGYPAVHHLTAELRKAAASAGDARLVHLWAGTGYRQAKEEPVARTLQRISADL
ncbi:2-nitropropane dioxygenase [Streptomyces sp. Act143]|uniref:nitronate monooxygenase n=1 Tax=Streptomyces sp. Act143 TaxID=2200760 RepID=UPI000D67EED1|nr:nitronate monooxygenase [Streptomyces sp. Act143]PWI19358.1 2-nitropropane dioxygenase [Streptomyces sp. Act143]